MPIKMDTMPTELPEIKSEIKAEDFITNSSSNDSPHHSSQTPNTLVDPQLQSATTTCGWVGKKLHFLITSLCQKLLLLGNAIIYVGFAFYNHKLMIKPKYKLSVRTHTFSFLHTYESAAEVISDQRIFVFDRQYRQVLVFYHSINHGNSQFYFHYCKLSKGLLAIF